MAKINKILLGLCFVIGSIVSNVAFAFERPPEESFDGPFEIPSSSLVVRVSNSGFLQIFGLNPSVKCLSDKADVYATSPAYDQIFSIALAGQKTGKAINLWISRYGKFDKRCSVDFIELTTVQ